MIEIEDAKFMQTIGRTVRDFRQAKGLTQEQLGDIVGLSQSAIAKIEKGKVSISVARLRVVAMLCRMKVSDLLRKAEAEEVFWKAGDPSEADLAG